MGTQGVELSEPSYERIEDARTTVFERPEFAPREPTPIERLLEWLGELFEGFGLSGEPPEGLAQAVLWGLLIFTVALLVLAMRRVARERPQRREADEFAGPTVRERVEQLREQAARARAAGDRLGALRLYFFALVVGLGRKGDLEYRDAWTNRELLARGRPSESVAAELGPLVAELDHKMFGDGRTEDADVDRLAALCDRWLGPRGAEADGGEA